MITEDKYKEKACEIYKQVTYDQKLKPMDLCFRLARIELMLEQKEEKSFEDDTEEFLFACKEERNKFCTDIIKQQWNTELRTSAENILVMYDQLMTRLENAARGK